MLLAIKIIIEAYAAAQPLLAHGLTLYATPKPNMASWAVIPTTLTRLASRWALKGVLK
jgi:hypothetical protein